MQSKANNMTEEQQTIEQPQAPGPGELLRDARLAAKLSTQDVATKIRLKKSMIEDIEQDNYDVNISLTFIKGYLKLYAKNVQANESEVLNAFEKLNTQKKEPAKLKSFSRRFTNQANDDKLMLVTYLILAIVIALVVVWWFQQSSVPNTSPLLPSTQSPELQGSNEGDRTNNIDSIPANNVIEAVPIEVDETIASTAQNSTLSLNSVDQTDTESNSPALHNNPIETEQERANFSSEALTSDLNQSTSVESTTVELVFEFSGDCWMNLADATGENIAFGVKVKGRTMPVSGIPPFTVTLGAPEVVKISYAGKPLDMSFLTPGRIAKFELPLSD